MEARMRGTLMAVQRAVQRESRQCKQRKSPQLKRLLASHLARAPENNADVSIVVLLTKDGLLVGVSFSISGYPAVRRGYSEFPIPFNT